MEERLISKGPNFGSVILTAQVLYGRNQVVDMPNNRPDLVPSLELDAGETLYGGGR